MIIKDEAPLLETFVPEAISHRDGQKQAIAECLKPILMGMKPRNAFLYGPCGTGKTLIATWILKELESHSSMAKTAYVNCWRRTTTHACLTEILRQLDVFTNYKQSTAELLQMVEKESKKKQLVICLDEFDMLESKEILYNLSRLGIGLILIANDPYALVDVDPRIKSSLNAESIEFPAYKPDEIFDILKERRKYALVPGAIRDEELKMIARLCNGDARIAIETLRRAALIAEEKEEKRIVKEDIQKAFGSTKNLRKTEALKKLNEHEKALYMLLEKHKTLDTVRLFALYKEAVEKPSSQRSYRNYMKHLVQLGLVKSYGELTGRKYEIVV